MITITQLNKLTKREREERPYIYENREATTILCSCSFNLRIQLLTYHIIISSRCQLVHCSMKICLILYVCVSFFLSLEMKLKSVQIEQQQQNVQPSKLDGSEIVCILGLKRVRFDYLLYLVPIRLCIVCDVSLYLIVDIAIILYTQSHITRARAAIFISFYFIMYQFL